MVPLSVRFTAKTQNKFLLNHVQFLSVLVSAAFFFLMIADHACFNSPCLPDNFAGFCCSHLIEKPTNRQLRKNHPK